MGRIKTTFVKKIGRDIYETDPERFTEDFSHNKQVVSEMADAKSKKLLNIVAGYVTTLKRREMSSKVQDS